jgi:hypothetical protein
MSEIIKLYENVGIEKRLLCGDRGRDVLCGHVRPDGKSRMAFGCFGCEYKNDAYPSFTAEKQLEIVKFLLHKGVYYDTDGDTYWFHYTDEIENSTYRPFEEAIAEFMNAIWQDLTEEERKQIKGILE